MSYRKEGERIFNFTEVNIEHVQSELRKISSEISQLQEYKAKIQNDLNIIDGKISDRIIKKTELEALL
jgi:archaellum component FlaC